MPNSQTIKDAKRYTETRLYASGTKSMSTTLDNTAATLNGDGTVTLASTTHGFAVSSQIYIQGTTYYDGLHKLTAVAANSITFAVDDEQPETPAGSETIDVIIKPEVPFTLHETRLTVNTAATTAEDFSTTLDSNAGASWDLVIDPVAMLGETDIHRMPVRQFRFDDGDALLFDWTNTDGRTWALEVVYGVRGYGTARGDVKDVG